MRTTHTSVISGHGKIAGTMGMLKTLRGYWRRKADSVFAKRRRRALAVRRAKK